MLYQILFCLDELVALQLEVLDQQDVTCFGLKSITKILVRDILRYLNILRPKVNIGYISFPFSGS